MAQLISGYVPLVNRVAFIPILPLAISERQETETTNAAPVLRKRASTLCSVLDHLKPSSPTSKSSSDYCYSLSRDSVDEERLMHRYRCEILAVSSRDHVSAEAECKQLVIEAGGKILDNIRYPGGFLFDMSYLAALPLETGDETAEGGSIVVEMVEEFVLSCEIKGNDNTDKRQNRLWRIKSDRRLQKKPPSPSREQEHGCCNMRFRPPQLTMNECLMEQTIERRSNETEWLTVSDQQE